MATAPLLGRSTSREKVHPLEHHQQSSIWSRASTWGLLLLLLYFALDGVSPFVNEPTAIRAVSTGSAGGVVVDRLGKLLVFVFCMLFVLPRHHAIRRMSQQLKLLTSFPVCAILLCPLSQMPSRTISSGVLLLGGSAPALFHAVPVYSQPVAGTAAYAGYRYHRSQHCVCPGPCRNTVSIKWAATPRPGRVSSAPKNYLGNLALFFLTGAVSYSPRTRLLGSVRIGQILLCLTSIAFSQAATAYLLTAVYLVYLVTVKVLHRFRKKDYFLLGLLLLLTLFCVVMLIAVWPTIFFDLLGKDVTLTGRTGIWTAVLQSIFKRPLLGYGYQAFWLGLEGESYRVILEVSWVLAQAQNGFLDVTLELGVVGLVIVLLIFAFAFRDAIACLLRSRDQQQLRAVEWYLAVVLLTLLYNLDESFLFEPKHLGSMMFVLACAGPQTRMGASAQCRQISHHFPSADSTRSGDLGRIRRHCRLEAFHRFAVAVEEKLGKVPLDVAADLGIAGLIRQKCIQRCLIPAPPPILSTSSEKTRCIYCGKMS